MFAPHQSASRAYRQLDVTTAVQTADPHRLITLLYDGAIDALVRARGALERGDVPAKGEAISKALRIVEEGLKAALDERGGEVTANLRTLYQHATLKLLRANVENDGAAIEEVAALLRELRAAWEAIRPAAAPRNAAAGLAA